MFEGKCFLFSINNHYFALLIQCMLKIGLEKLLRTHLFKTFKAVFVQNVFIGHVFIVLNKFY